MLGVALVPTAGFSWLFVLPVQLQDRANNPYVVRMSAWRINSCCNLSGAPVSPKRLRKVWRNVCQPMQPMPQRTAAGEICCCCTLQGCKTYILV